MKLKGFTLLEMVFVMIVISLILLVTLPNIQKTIAVVQKTGCDAQIKLVDAALLQFHLEHQKIPASIGELVNLGYIKQNQTQCDNGHQISISGGQAH